MKRKNVFFKAGILLFSLLLVPGMVGCGAPAKPSSVTFQGVSWRISSVETMKASETWLRPMTSSRWASNVLIVVTFEVQGDPLPYIDRHSFTNITLRETNRTVEQLILVAQEEEGNMIDTSYRYRETSAGGLEFIATGPIKAVQCIFSVDEGTKSVELILPDSQIIEITLKD